MAQENQTTKTIQLTTPEIENLIAFGNRANMTGAEADTWVQLKYKLVDAATDGDGVPGIDLDDDDLKPGGTA